MLSSFPIWSGRITIQWSNGPWCPCMSIWVIPKIGIPQNGWFIMENPIKMNHLGVPLFSETPIWMELLECMWCIANLFFSAHTLYNMGPKNSFNPSEKYYIVKLEIFPKEGWTWKIFELPPPSPTISGDGPRPTGFPADSYLTDVGQQGPNIFSANVALILCRIFLGFKMVREKHDVFYVVGKKLGNSAFKWCVYK